MGVVREDANQISSEVENKAKDGVETICAFISRITQYSAKAQSD